MAEVFAGREDEFEEGHARLLELGDYEIGVYRHAGEYYAYRNQCAHQGGPACEGIIIGRVHDVLAPDKTFLGQRFDEDDPQIVCPWHGWEFRLRTGESPADPRWRLRRYNVLRRDGNVYVIV
jgi:nitrite reductase/ring-hydroxylating ferredoxin subunit